MYWQEDETNLPYTLPEDIVDLVFGMDCRMLPVDHMQALADALMTVLPWLRDEPAAGIHPIHAADSGNGWYSAEDGEDEFFYPSRRTKLILRLPREG